MAKTCSHCGKEIKFSQSTYYHLRGKEILLCKECGIKQDETYEEEKESADDILKKRLARSEITKEEFHDKIQRT